MSDEGGDNPPPKQSTGESESTKQEDKAPPPAETTAGTETEDTAAEDSATEVSETEESDTEASDTEESETESTEEESTETTETGNGETSEQEDELLPPDEAEDEAGEDTEEASESTETEDTAAEDAVAEQTAAKTEEVKSAGSEGTVLADNKTATEGDSGTPVIEGDVMPKGFDNSEQAAEFTQALNDGLDEAGYPETQAAFQGSSVTGVGYATGRPFGDHSDYDVALGGEGLFNAAKEAGVELRADGTRTAPLTAEQIDQLGLSDMHAELEEIAGGREVNFMVFQNINGALARSPSMLVPRRR